jgi:hypothetical protein
MMPSMRHIAMAVAALWAGWWVIFDAADAIQRREFGYAILFAVAVSVPVAIARKWPVAGGTLLVLASVASALWYVQMWVRSFDFWQIVLLFAIMPLPPLAAGVLLLLSAHPHVSHKPAHTV